MPPCPGFCSYFAFIWLWCEVRSIERPSIHAAATSLVISSGWPRVRMIVALFNGAIVPYFESMPAMRQGSAVTARSAASRSRPNAAAVAAWCGRLRSCAGSSPVVIEKTMPASASFFGSVYAASVGAWRVPGRRCTPRTMTGTPSALRNGIACSTPSPPTTTGLSPRDFAHATPLSICEALPTSMKTGSLPASTSRIASARRSWSTVGSAARASLIAFISSKKREIFSMSSFARFFCSSGERRDTRTRAGSTTGQVMTRPTAGSTVMSAGVQPSRRIADAVPPTTPPSGALTASRMPAARATVRRSLSGLIAMAGTASGRNSPNSRRSSVVSTESVSTRPSVVGNAQKPGETCMPCASTISQFGGSSGMPAPTDTMRPPSKRTWPFSMTGVSASAVWTIACTIATGRDCGFAGTTSLCAKAGEPAASEATATSAETGTNGLKRFTCSPPSC